MIGRWCPKTPWWKEWLPTPVFLPGGFHGQRGLVGYIVHGVAESLIWLLWPHGPRSMGLRSVCCGKEWVNELSLKDRRLDEGTCSYRCSVPAPGRSCPLGPWAQSHVCPWQLAGVSFPLHFPQPRLSLATGWCVISSPLPPHWGVRSASLRRGREPGLGGLWISSGVSPLGSCVSSSRVALLSLGSPLC